VGASAAIAGVASTASKLEGRGLVVAVIDTGDGQLSGCLDSVASQSRMPARVVLVRESGGSNDPRWSRQRLDERGWRVVEAASGPTGNQRYLAMQAVLELDDVPLGVAVVESGWRLAPAFVEVCQSVLERDDCIGLVSSWFSESGPWRRVRLPPAPAWPYQWLADDVSPCCVVRATALREVRAFDDQLGPDASTSPTELALAVLADGWRAVTYPALLSWRTRPLGAETEARTPIPANRFRGAVLERWAAAPSSDLAALQAFLQSGAARGSEPPPSVRGAYTPKTILGQPLEAQMRLVGRAVRNPRYAAGWIGWHARRAWREALRRLGRS
jgi:hypothetical protein